MTRQNILITGASSGLGKAMAINFAKMGRNLALCARRIERLEELKSELDSEYPNINVYIRALDVDNHDQVFEVFNSFKKDMGSIDRIIVNAGVGNGASVGTGFFHVNKKVAITNFVSALAQCEVAMEIFREQNFGHLVTMSSFSSLRGFRRVLTVYAATKSAVAILTEGIRIDVQDTPIKVTTIHPGFIKSEMTDKVKTAPFMVDLETGGVALIKAIEKEPNISYVPTWPWALLRYPMKIISLKLLSKMS
jgi:short-subunit dehydrogenase